MEKVKDSLYPLNSGDYMPRGIMAKANNFVIKNQLKDKKLWERLVHQFTYNSDDCDNGWRGEFWGKLIRGASLVYRFTNDKELYKIMTDSVKSILLTQDSNGRIATYSTEKEFSSWDMWCRKYVLLGLEYYYDICKSNELKEQIVSAMKKHADYILANVGENKLNINETSDQHFGMNSSSVLEPIVLLYKITEENRYKDFAGYIVSQGGMSKANIFELAYKNEIPPYKYPSQKAYEMMSCFEGLMEYYRITGNEKYKYAVLNFIDSVAKTEITLIGSAGCTQEKFDNSAITQFKENESGIMQETCVTVTWIKLCYQALRLTGDFKYADYIEKSYYNAMLGTLNTKNSTKAGGMTFDSYSPLINQTRGCGMGGIRILDLFNFFGCCSAIGACGIGLGGISAVMRNEDSLIVNMFENGKYCAIINGKKARINIISDYPKSPDIVIDVLEGEFKLAVRIPSYSENTRVLIDGHETICNRVFELSVTRPCKIQIFQDYKIKQILPEHFGADSKKYKMCGYTSGPIVLALDEKYGLCAPRHPEKLKRIAFEHGIMQYSLTEDGNSIILTDYASCGKDNNNKYRIYAWMSK